MVSKPYSFDIITEEIQDIINSTYTLFMLYRIRNTFVLSNLIPNVKVVRVYTTMVPKHNSIHCMRNHFYYCGMFFFQLCCN